MSLDVNGMVGAVRKVQAWLRASSESNLAEALHTASQVAYFLLDGHGPNFEDYLAVFMGAELPSLGTFFSRDDFDVWRKSRTALGIRGELSIAGVRYCLGYSRADGVPLLLRLPRLEDLTRPPVGEGREQLWRALDKANETFQPSSEDRRGLQSAMLALHFVAESGCTRDFVHFLAHLDVPLPSLCVFTTRDEAESWLNQHPRPPHGALVQVGEEMLTVGYQRERDQRMLVRFPEDKQLAP